MSNKVKGLDKETKSAIIAIQNGTLIESLKKSMKRTTIGLAIGGAAGILIATFTGKPRMLFALGGAAIGGMAGKLSS